MKALQIDALQEMRRSTLKHLQTAAARAGFNLSEEFSIGPDEATFTLIFKENEKAAFATREAEDFKFQARFYGLTPEHLGRMYRTGRHTYVLIGMKPRSSRYPALGREVGSGKVYKTSMPKQEDFLDG